MVNEQLTELGPYLKRIRRSIKPRISQQAMAKSISVSDTWVSRVETGIGNPSLDFVTKYTNVLGYNPEQQSQVITRYARDIAVRRALVISLEVDLKLQNLATAQGIEVNQLLRKFIAEGIENFRI